VPKEMWNKRIIKKKDMGWTDSRMHISGKICYVVWKASVPVLLLSIHAKVESRDRIPLTIKKKKKGGKEAVPTSPMHLQYQKNMRGVDNANEL